MEYDFNGFVHIGRSTAKHYGFVELGYRKFTHGFSDVLRIQIEHGWKVGEHFYLAAALDANPSLQNGTFRNENLEQTGLYPNNQEANAISIKAAYETEEGWGANVAMPIVPIRFKYIGYNGTLSFGVYRKF